MRVLGWPTRAHRDRPSDRPQPAASGPRRGGLGTRRLDPEPDPRIPRAAPRRTRGRLSLHLPQPLRHPLARGPTASCTSAESSRRDQPSGSTATPDTGTPSRCSPECRFPIQRCNALVSASCSPATSRIPCTHPQAVRSGHAAATRWRCAPSRFLPRTDVAGGGWVTCHLHPSADVTTAEPVLGPLR